MNDEDRKKNDWTILKSDNPNLKISRNHLLDFSKVIKKIQPRMIGKTYVYQNKKTVYYAYINKMDMIIILIQVTERWKKGYQ
jgi:hypothetical protein